MARKTTGMSGGVSRHACVGAFRSTLINEASSRDSRHKVADLSCAAPALESGLWVCFGSFPPVPLLPVDNESFGSENRSPRWIFGPAPTLDEANEASSFSLKEAIEKVCHQPNPTLDYREDCQSSVSGKTRTVSKPPKRISQMFSLLHQSSEVQAVVASIAKDECVFDAVMKNKMVAEFLKNVPPNVDSANSIAVNECPKESHTSPEGEKTCKGTMFSNMVKNVSGKTRTEYKQPKHISQMFSLLHQSSEVQTAVASIAKDKCVFEAVMKNEMVAEFLKNVPPNVDSAKSGAVNECPEEAYPSPESEKTCKGSMFSNMVNNVKVKVSEKASNISDFLHDFLAKPSRNSSSLGAMPTVSTAEALHPDKASFFALAVAAILIVLFMT